jgi:oxygen-dependent protoporphyrinogen oxidase
VLLTSFVGGATDRPAAALSAQELRELVHREIAPVLQIHGAPVFSHVHIYQRALPQYNIGHEERLTALDKLCGGIPGLFLVGNYLRGPAIGNCVELATTTAQALANQVKSAEARRS